MSERYQPELWLTVGLPRSGKSTWARSTGHPIVCPDAIRQAVHGTGYRAESEPLVWAIAKTMVAALFAAGHRVVVLDATNTTVKRRAEWENPGWIRCVKVFDTDAETCRQRAVADGREDLLPVIDRMAAQWEDPWSDIATHDHLGDHPWDLKVCGKCGLGVRCPKPRPLAGSGEYACAGCVPSYVTGAVRQG